MSRRLLAVSPLARRPSAAFAVPLARYSDNASSQRASPRAQALAIFASTFAGGVTAAYFLWPSEYRGAPTFNNRTLSPSHFTPVTVTASEPCGPDLKLLTLAIPPHALPSPSDASILSPVWSVFIKDDDIQVERPYTPLEGIDDQGCIKLWVKKYPKGEVGRWLHAKDVGESLELRGPLRTFPFYKGTWDEVVKISGGTGFSPFYQLLHRELLQDSARSRSTRFTLLHGSPSSAELPPPAYLQPLLKMAEEHPERLRIGLYVESQTTSPSTYHRLQTGRIDKAAIERALGLSSSSTHAWWRRLFRLDVQKPEDRDFLRKNVLVLVCGPEPYVLQSCKLVSNSHRHAG
ncbi:hypothetical protein BV25DRAFT_1817743 [Artomyces pyxidatus]|uniref:Uncharacterized protein n=1 Tax=Artomyces pyxidatus TaxID=48021 RepID=A0ACB8TKC7_9AGAM|nr:hypothetical protein BV25DRAFT_1817743 [Artomyces pyxidatus]